jgi:hypothetical protein
MRKRVNALLKDVFRIQYADTGLSEEELRKMLKEFEKAVHALVNEKPRRNVLQRFFHKVFRKYEPPQAMRTPRFSPELKNALETRLEAAPIEKEKEEKMMDAPVKVIEKIEPQALSKEEEKEEVESVQIAPWTDDLPVKDESSSSEWIDEPVVIVKKKGKEEKKAGKKESKADAEKSRQIKEKKDVPDKRRQKKDRMKKEITSLIEKKRKDVDSHSLEGVEATEKRGEEEKAGEKEKEREKDVFSAVNEERSAGISKGKDAALELMPALPNKPHEDNSRDPKTRIEELLGKIDDAVGKSDALLAKKLYNDMHLIYKNVGPEVKHAYYSRVHESYGRIKGITPVS